MRVVGGVLGQQQDLDLRLQRLDPVADLGDFRLGQRPHLGIAALVGGHRLQPFELALGRAQIADARHHVLQVGIFRGHADIGIGIGRRRHLRFEHVETLDDLVHAIAGKRDHA